MPKKRKIIKIGKYSIGDGFPVFIVAETGTNHQGEINIAIKMVEEAKRIGADAVKFQTIDADASYIKGTIPYNIYKNIKFKKDDWLKIKKAADKNRIILFSAPADIPSVDILKDLNLPLIKISSGSMTNIALVRKMAKLKIPVMISTGMSYVDEVKNVVSEFEGNGNRNLMLLHCSSLYPAPVHQLNLNAITSLRKEFSYPIGYSDHTVSNIPSVIAVSLGARIIEKHFTIDRSLGGPEQKFSYSLNKFEKLINDIRFTEISLGNGIKAPSGDEFIFRSKFRRCLVANMDIKRGKFITKEMIGMKRPLLKPGLNTSYFEKILGKKACLSIKKNEPIHSNFIKW